jgi:hypothetical protein
MGRGGGVRKVQASVQPYILEYMKRLFIYEAVKNSYDAILCC